MVSYIVRELSCIIERNPNNHMAPYEQAPGNGRNRKKSVVEPDSWSEEKEKNLLIMEQLI